MSTSSYFCGKGAILSAIKIALISDIHGNINALEAVLADIQAHGGVEAIWIAGDLVAFGHAPVRTMEKLASLPSITAISGNTDRFLLTGEQPSPTAEQVMSDPHLFIQYTEVTRSLAWTLGAVATRGGLPWLDALPAEARFTLPDGTRVLMAHASPGHDDGPALYPDSSSDHIRSYFTGHDAELIIVGHTHWSMETHVDKVHVVNVGSISNPISTDTRAVWVCLECHTTGYNLTYHRVAYDVDSVIHALDRLHHPGKHWLRRMLSGQHQPCWQQTFDTESREMAV